MIDLQGQGYDKIQLLGIRKRPFISLFVCGVGYEKYSMNKSVAVNSKLAMLEYSARFVPLELIVSKENHS